VRLLRGFALAAVLGAACTADPAEPTRETPPLESIATSPATDPATVASPSPAPSADPSPTAADPPPPRTRFAGRISPIPTGIAEEMTRTTWEPGCPVALEDLRLLHFNYLGLDGEVHRGPMVVNASAAEDVLWVFEQLYEAGFPLKHVELARRWRPNGPIDTTRSVTASFNCRPALNPDGTPSGSWSEHAYGLAVDVNPLQNPYVASDGSVRRPAAEAYVDRAQDLPGMIHPGDVVVRSFAAIGWEWGGDWSGKKDYMHFSLRGR
jgi:hypothetical protein